MARRYLQIAIRALRLLCRYPLRSCLFILSAAVGVAGVVCSVNYGAGGSRQVLDQIHRMGTNVLSITPAQSRVVAGRARSDGAVTTLVERDYVTLCKGLQSRVRSSAVAAASFWIKAGDLSKNTAVVGVEPEYFEIKSWPAADGGLFGDFDERTAGRVAVLGHTVASDLFGSSSPVGERVMINRVPFIVDGVLSERGQGLDVNNEDNQVYVPLTTIMRRLLNVDHYSGIVIEIDSTDSMDAAAGQLRSQLRNLHHVGPNQPDDFQVQNQKTLLDTQMAASERLNFFLQWIAASALTVSGLGIVAIAWVALKERSREIGTRRALGATRSDIFFQMLFEMGAISVIGCLLGLGVSWPASRFISQSAGLPFVFEGKTAGLALVTALMLHLVFSVLPSRKAASVSPLEALRYE